MSIAKVGRGELKFVIVGPSTNGVHTTDQASIEVIARIEGWRLVDPTPRVTLRIDATGVEDSSFPSWFAPFVVETVALEPGANAIRFDAANGVQRSSSASIAVTRNP